MKLRPIQMKSFAAITSTSLFLAACATTPTVSDGAAAARANLMRLQADSTLAPLARVEIMAAEEAVMVAERPIADASISQHRVMMADTRVEIARSWAQSRLYQEQRNTLRQEVETMRLNARTQEVDRARDDARSARSEAETARAAAVLSRTEAEAAENRSRVAQDAADLARTATDEARAESADLQRQISELNARSTDRGLVMTLGDIMFETGQFELRSGTTTNLDKLASFLSQYEDRTVEIEGHTDSIGSAESNLILSRQRADAVADYLFARGIDRMRLSSASMGEESPVADNESSTGRQQNRRVEVIISNEPRQAQ